MLPWRPFGFEASLWTDRWLNWACCFHSWRFPQPAPNPLNYQYPHTTQVLEQLLHLSPIPLPNLPQVSLFYCDVSLCYRLSSGITPWLSAIGPCCYLTSEWLLRNIILKVCFLKLFLISNNYFGFPPNQCLREDFCIVVYLVADSGEEKWITRKNEKGEINTYICYWYCNCEQQRLDFIGSPEQHRKYLPKLSPGGTRDRSTYSRGTRIVHTGPEHHSAPPWTLVTGFPRIPDLELFSGSIFFLSDLLFPTFQLYNCVFNCGFDLHFDLHFPDG